MRNAGNALRMAVLAVALAEAMAILLIFLVPEKRAFWLIAGLAMPLLWTGAEAMKRDKESIRYSVAGAALLIAVGLAVSAARAVGLFGPGEGDIAVRLFGAINGLILIVYGNVVPKKLVRYDPDDADPGRKPALRRYTGWVFVLAGLANALIWLIAPIDRAATWSMIPVAGGLALIAMRLMRTTRMKGNGA